MGKQAEEPMGFSTRKLREEAFVLLFPPALCLWLELRRPCVAGTIGLT